MVQRWPGLSGAEEMTDRAQQICDRLQAVLLSYSPPGLERLARRLIRCASESLAATRMQVIQHRAFGRERKAAEHERLLVEHERDLELGRVLLELALLNRR